MRLLPRPWTSASLLDEVSHAVHERVCRVHGMALAWTGPRGAGTRDSRWQRDFFHPHTDPSPPLRPSPGSIKTTAALLAATKRKFGSYEAKLGDWNELFSKTGGDLRDVGMSVSDRRYLLWILEKFR